MNETIRKTALTGAAMAAALATMGVATQASAAQEIKITDVEMNRTYEATLTGLAQYPGGVTVYSNGIQFTASYVGNGPLGQNGKPVADLFGFCIDVYHEINLGPQTLYYNDNQGDLNPLTTDYGNPAHPLTNANPALGPDNKLNQITDITSLVDTGYYIHQHEASFTDAEMQIAAIQAAIWQVEVPTIHVQVINANLNAADFTKYQNYFNLYMSPNYTTYEDANDRVFTITSLSDPSHQNFAIGWPVQGVPEPATWAMMLVGFGGLGAMLRQRKARAAAATA